MQQKYIFRGNIPPKTRKLIKLANCSSAFSLIPETFFATSQQETILKSSHILQKYGVEHTLGSLIRLQLPSVGELPGCKQLRRGLFEKMIQFPANSTTEKDIVYF